jgi:hypothetical protein
MDGLLILAKAPSWAIRAEVNPMPCACETVVQVPGYAGQVRDLTVDWSDVVRVYGETTVVSVDWAVVVGAGTTLGSDVFAGLRSTVRVLVGTASAMVQATATFGSGQTARQSVAIRVDGGY